MAQFKLSLIVPNNDAVFNEKLTNQTETYLFHIITDYQDQQKEFKQNNNKTNVLKTHTVAYTYNEKLSIHKNGQQELSFNMDDKVCIDEEWIENPFARVLRTGVQIELQDKFKNRKLFTVNKIQYNFNNTSIVYQVTCQDSFTYQLNRQNNGYNLVNDETSTDFIGALNADAWAEQIAHDCYITYKYLPLWKGLYQDQYGVLHEFYAPGESVENPVLLGLTESNNNQVDKIIKPIYDTKTYAEFYETFPFSASNVSANAALISVAETLGLQLNIVEGLEEFDKNNPGAPLKYAKYFFFGPTKNPEISGLTYSPLRDIQSFGLNFSGDSLTTVLNIKSTTWNDEEISVFPTIPSFFNALFMSNDWKNTQYYNGFYIDTVKGQNYGYVYQENVTLDYFDFHHDNTGYYLVDNGDNSDGITIDGQRYWKAPIKNVKWANYYNKIRFYWEGQENITSFYVGGSVIFINSLQSNDKICFAYINNDDVQIFKQDEVITRPITWTNTENYWFLLVKRPDNDPNNKRLDLNTLYFTITRDYTDEELEFARIAESCPWLENKIMDFDYFVRQGILSKFEYEGLMNWLLNGLRIINGQLMCLANSYYYALHERTKILSRLEADTDALGATFYASVVDPYTKSGMISSNISDFINTYHQLFEADNINNQANGLLNINNVISDRFNKFFSAEQRFLQHMYNFRKYFEDKNIFSAGAVSFLDDVYYTIENDTRQGKNTAPDNCLVSFDGAIKWTALTHNSPIIHYEDNYNEAFVISSVYTFTDGKYVEQKIPNQFNYKEFYIPTIHQDQLTAIEDDTNKHHYNAANNYYLTYSKYQDYFGTPPEERVVTLEDNNTTSQYVRLSYQEIVKIFLSQNYNVGAGYYIRDTDLKVPFDWVRVNYTTISNKLNFACWPAVSILREVNPDVDIQVIEKTFGSTTAWELYKSMSPIDELYIYDYWINYTTQQNNGNELKYNFEVLDQKGNPYSYEDGHYYRTIRKSYTDPDTQEEISYSDLYRKFYSVPFLSYAQNATSIISNNQNDTSASFSATRFYNDVMSTQKNSKYFVHYEDYTAKGWAIAGGILFSLLSYAIIPGAGPLCTIGGIAGAIIGGTHKYAHWGKKDDTTFDMSYYNGNEWTEFDYNQARGKSTSSSDKTQKLGDTTKHLKGDSHWVNYVQKEDSELTIRGLSTTWWDGSNNNWYSWLDRSHTSNYKHYFNYYQQIVGTYSQGALSHEGYNDYDTMDNYLNASYDDYYFDSSTGKILTPEARRTAEGDEANYNYDYYWVKNRYARFCKKTDGINPKDTYVWVPVDFLKDDVVIGTNFPERFGAIKYYPLVELREEINFSGVFSKEELNDNPTWSKYLEKMGESDYDVSFDSTTDYVKLTITGDNLQNPIIFYALHLEPYEKLKVSTITATLTTHNPSNFTIDWRDVEGRAYHCDNDRQVIASEIMLGPVQHEEGGDIVNDLFFISEKDDSLVKVEELNEDFNWTDIDLHWYTSPDINSRTYTVAQICGDTPQTARIYYYMSNTELSAAEFRSSESVITPDKFKVCLRKYSIDEEEQLIIDDNVLYDEAILTFDATQTTNSQDLSLFGYDFIITRHRINYYDIGNMSNGTFWYHFHNRLDFPLIAEKAMIIETQLTTEWTQAYTASQYCEWFIPEYWQIDAATNKNAWFSSIWQVNQDGNILLSSLFVPEVEIYKYQGKTTLDGVLFNYHPDINATCKKEEYEIDKLDFLKNNPAIMHTIQHIFDDVSEVSTGKLTVQKYATQTYYYCAGGGTEHKNLIRTLDSQQKIYKYYDGLYAMQLFLLLTKYHNIEAPAYESTLDEKLRLWQMLYARYPGIFLENTYENKDARSSEQLLQLAQLAFKDYSSPEKNYNITIIDAASLSGYQGQELHIGDGILLNTSDYYDAVDETYRALNQYLFISDISYNLRQDTDISLTVNPIKYQDKLLQSIVKLIR